MKRRSAVLAGLAAGALFPAIVAAAIPCAELTTGFSAPEVAITSATAVPEVTSGNNAAPAHCDGRGTIRGNIKFAVFLPVDWNGRFQMVGNGGKAGSISTGDMRTQLRLGYASASTDTGHDNTIQEIGRAACRDRGENDAIAGAMKETD